MENTKTMVFKSEMTGMWTVKYWRKYTLVARYMQFSDWTDAINAAFLVSSDY